MTTNTKGGVMKVKGSRRLVARLGLALAVAAFAVPTASAMTINVSGGGVGGRHYADDLHASSMPFTLPASNVRTDAASVQRAVPGANVRTDASSYGPSPFGDLRNDNVSFDVTPIPGANVRTDAASSLQPVSDPAASIRTDAASSFRPVSNLASNVVTDSASSTPLTDARHSALLAHRAQLDQEPTQLASTPLPSNDSPGIDWGVAAIGAALGLLGLMLLFSIVFYAGRHNRGRLAAT